LKQGFGLCGVAESWEKKRKRMLVPAEVWTVAKAEQGSAVLIRPVGSEVAVPIMIGQPEAQSIMIGLANHNMPRPLTHDLLISVLKHISAPISRVEITELKDETFFGRLILNKSGKDVSIDARPSDCIAIAVRVKCPIYIDELVVDKAGIAVNIINEVSDSESREEEITDLRKKLDEAVEIEDYEEAATLRDQITELEIDSG
jgi:bifunctional DNase/RNase